jgi:hypothetical protein
VGGEQPYHELNQRHGSPGTPSGTLLEAGILMTLIWICLCHSHSCSVDNGDVDDSEVLFDQRSNSVKSVEEQRDKVLAVDTRSHVIMRLRVRI